MNYKLAKQLKDAGFPQIPKGRRILGFIIPLRCPTLSELIEACGDDFIELVKVGKRFEAHSDCYGNGYDASYCEIEVEGKTPEEAVAKLWLELNK